MRDYIKYFLLALLTLVAILLEGFKKFLDEALRWIPRIVFLVFMVSAFLATIEQGLKPISAQSIYIMFFGINFITLCLFHGVRADKEFSLIVVELNDGLGFEPIIKDLIERMDRLDKGTSGEQKNDYLAPRLEDTPVVETEGVIEYQNGAKS